MKRNKYIAFEGLDACGKTTQSESLVERLNARGYKALWTREPGSPLIDINLRDLILSHKKVAPATLELILQADRAEHTSKIKELLAEGYWIVSDRSALSGFVYATACGNRAQSIQNVMDFSIQVYPDQVFFLDIPVEEAERRRLDRAEPPTREEIKGLDFKNKLRAGFKELVKYQSASTAHGEPVPILEIDGLLRKEVIAETIDKALGL